MTDRRFSVVQKNATGGNRAQRRQAERNARRGITHTDRVVALPALLDEFTVFDIPQRIFGQLKNGAIDAVDDGNGKLIPVFLDNAGDLTEVVPAMLGWIETWEMISEKLNLDLSLRCLKFLSASLLNHKLVTPQLLQGANREFETCRNAFRSADRKEIVSIAKTAQLKILLEEKTNQPHH